MYEAAADFTPFTDICIKCKAAASLEAGHITFSFWERVKLTDQAQEDHMVFRTTFFSTAI